MGTNARSGGSIRAPGGSVPDSSTRPGSTPTRPASPRSAGATSATPSIERAAVGTPARASASASSRRFSSTHITTRSGRSSTIARTSGSLVPPTCGTSGRSQNLVHATGDTPQASKVSVTEGTRLMTRGAAADTRVPLHAVEERLLLAGELVFGEEALLAQLVELADLGGDRLGVVACAGGGRTRGGGDADAVELAVLVGLDLAVDLVLHGGGLAHVGEPMATNLTRRLDHQVAGADEALEQRLPEEHRVHPIERDLDAVLRQHAVPVDEPVGGNDEVGGDPARVAPREPTEEAEHEEPGGDLQRRGNVVRQRQDAEDHRTEQCEQRRGEEPPVGVQVEDDVLGVVEQLPRERHARIVSLRHRPCTGPYAQPSWSSRSSSMPKWWAISWTTVMRTCSTTSSSSAHAAQMGSRKIVTRSGIVSPPP